MGTIVQRLFLVLSFFFCVSQEALSAELNKLGMDYNKGSEEETSLNTAQKETSNQTTVEHREIQR